MSKHKQSTGTHRFVIVLIALAAGLVFGCGTDSIVDPGGNGAGAQGTLDIRQSWTPGRTGQDLEGTQLPKEEIQWSQVGNGVALPGEETEVLGSRYIISLFPESLKDPVFITIKERDPGVVDVELGPHGTKFEEPVKFEIDYSGTANDPSSPNFHGFAPQLFWWNPATRDWEAMIGSNDIPNRTYTVYLEHFSRYAMRDGADGQGFTKGVGPDHDRVADTDEQQWEGEQQW